MSLKAFHLLFVAASELLLFGFAAFENYRYWHFTLDGADFWLGTASSLIGVALLPYAWYFLRKTRDIGLI